MHPRSIELKLLLLGSAAASALALSLYYSLSEVRHYSDLQALLFLLGPLFGALVIHVTLRRMKPAADPVLLPVAFMLTSISATFVARLNADLAMAQLFWITGGFLGSAVLIAFVKDIRRVAEYKYLLGTTAIVLLLVPAFLGREVGGAKLWITLFGISFQPGELAKVFLVLFLAAYFSEKRELIREMSTRVMGVQVPHLRYLGPLLVMWVVSLMIMVLERDLGSSLLFFSTFIVLSYIATERKFFLVAGTGLFLFGATLSYLLFTHVASRVDVWLDPFADPLGKGYQIVQSIFAISAGGFFGVGPGNGSGALIPAAATDMIASIISEELGLLGVSAIFLIYAIFFTAIMRIALRSDDDLHKVAAAGFGVNLFFQVFIILGGVSKFLPLTGITLNFVSYGGTSIMVNMLILSLLLHISDKGARP